MRCSSAIYLFPLILLASSFSFVLSYYIPRNQTDYPQPRSYHLQLRAEMTAINNNNNNNNNDKFVASSRSFSATTFSSSNSSSSSSTIDFHRKRTIFPFSSFTSHEEKRSSLSSSSLNLKKRDISPVGEARTEELLAKSREMRRKNLNHHADSLGHGGSDDDDDDDDDDSRGQKNNGKFEG